MKNLLPFSRWTLPGLFVALGLLYGLQAKTILRTLGGDTASETSFERMQVRANGTSLAVMTYLQNHDSESLGRIQSEAEEATRLLETLKQNAARQGNADSISQVVKAHEDMREATLTLLAADHEQVKSLQVLNTTGESLTAIMMARMEPSIKPSQLNSSSRLQAVLAAAAEARSISKNPGDISAVLTSQKRFHQAIQKYADLSRTQRAARWAEEATSLFDQCVGQAQEVERVADRKQVALTHYQQKKNVFDIVLQESRTMRGQRISIKQIITADMASVALGGLLLLLGFFVTIRQTNVTPMPRLQNILNCVEAAAAGDVSRLPEARYSDEIGILARAVGRLIVVLGRSEKLVYHLATLVESSGDAIISHSLEGSILSWNKGAQRLYGYSAEEMKGQSLSILSPAEDSADMQEYLQKLRKGDRILPFEIVHRARNGRSVSALLRVSPIYDSTRRILGASFSVQELSDVPTERLKFLKENELS